MANRYVTFRERDLGGGIDQESAENNITEGFAEDVQNMDPQSEGHIITRKGYQGYLGYLPFRVRRIEYTDDSSDNICLTLDSSVDLTTVASSPLVVRGRNSSLNTNNAGDFIQTTDSVNYYGSFTTDFRKDFLVGTNTLSFPQSEHGITTEFMFAQAVRSTSQVNNNNELISLDSVTIDTITNDIDFGYTNGTGSQFEGFVYALDNSAVSGTSFVSSATNIATGTNSYTITAATHNLTTFNILSKVYEVSGTDLIEVEVDDVTIETDGDVVFTITNNTGSAYDARFLLRSVSPSQTETGTIANGATESITITGLTSPFLFVNVYLEPTIGGDLELVFPGSITVDSAAGTATITFTNNTGSGANFEIYYEEGSIVTNKLCVTGSVIGGGDVYDDTDPQMTLWGLKHSETYGTREPREGWVNHIDSYRSVGEDRLVSGLGGNILAAQLRSEGSNASNYLIPLLYPNLRGRISADVTIGPVFYDTTDSPARTRGYIQADSAGNNFVEVSSATYQSGTGYTRYRLELPSKVVTGTLSTIISTTGGMEDYLTVASMGYSKLNGTFKIKAVTENASSLDIDVENSLVVNDDCDETDAGGTGGIFTDQLTFTATTIFLPGDLINDADNDFLTDQPITGVSGSTVVAGDITEQVTVPGGLRLVGKRTTSVIGLRDISGTDDVDNLLRGDMLTFGTLTRQLRAKYVRSADNISLSNISGSSGTATATLATSSTSDLSIGQNVLIRGSSNYNGAQTITAIPSTTTFQFASTQTTSETGTLIGKTLELDEELEIEDKVDSSNFFTAQGRWVPIEAPDDSFDLTPDTYNHHFDANTYSDQSILRSVMVQDNLYFTNGDDEVMKFDGTNIYRAGLFRWQPHLFVVTDTTPAAKIVTGNPSIAYTAASANYFTVADADRLVFPVGTEIEDDDDNERYFVVDTLDDGTSSYIYVDREVTGGTGSNLTRVSSYRYYFRLNAVDANDNVIASAVTGADDFIVKLSADAQVRIRMVGMPAWHIYDYDRLEVQVYRTQADQTGPYFRLTTLALNFNNNDGYVDYTDTDSDEDLTTLDEVNTALYGSELGTTVSEPLRAKYITSADNRLILSNLSDYPTIDLQLVQNNSGPIDRSALIANARWLFRKDNNDTGTDTDMVNRVAYEFTGTASVVAGITGTASTSFSVNVVGHGLAVGDWCYLFYDSVADGNDLLYSGWFQINSVTDADNFVINYLGAGSGAAVTFPTRMVKATTGTDVPVYLGTDGNYSMNNGNRSVTGPYEFLGMRRLANAINASMRNTDITLSGQEEFDPWMIGNAGNEFNIGQLIVKQPKVLSTSLELQIPTLNGDFDVFVNNVKRSSASSAGAISRLFPSRTIQSFVNFPEIFDAPTALQDTDSLSAIDVNSADGQEVTATIPFFGSSAFGAAQQNNIVVAFKENSIYLLNTAAKEAGENPIQKLESEGKGCTAPYSVANTKAGIMFANFTGIYRLRRNLEIDYVGRRYERRWLNDVDRDNLDLMTGHNFSTGNQYKLSLPFIDGDSISQNENNHVAVYNHTREEIGRGTGSWTRYTNHPVTGWANLLDDSYFATTEGEVFSIRRAGDLSDYRDDDQGIEFSLLTRSMDFGDSGIRKTFGWILSHFRTASEDISSITLMAGTDLASELDDTDGFVIRSGNVNAGASDNLSDTIKKKVQTLKSSLSKRIGNYLQLEYSGQTKDNPLELAGLDVRVAAKSSKGIQEASESTN